MSRRLCDHCMRMMRVVLQTFHGRVQIDEVFIEDSFNLTGIRPHVPHYSKALSLILDDADDLGMKYKIAMIFFWRYSRFAAGVICSVQVCSS